MQEELEQALRKVLGETTHDGAPLKLTVAGRTDRGVHAWGQVASYAHEAVDPLRLNGADRRRRRGARGRAAARGFDARRDATSRTYCYRVLARRTRGVFGRKRALLVAARDRPRAARGVRRDAAGKHDFTAFTPSETEHSWFRCDVRRAEWRAHGRAARVLDRGRHVPAPHEPRARGNDARRCERRAQRRGVREPARGSPTGRGGQDRARARAGAGERRPTSRPARSPHTRDVASRARVRASALSVDFTGPRRPPWAAQLCWKRMLNVLLTNDDGIEAEGLQAMRRALAAPRGRAPGGDRARRQPLGDGALDHDAPAAVGRRRSPFADGTVGYATDGTPVDCVRLASLGLVEDFDARARRRGHQPRREPRR